MSFPQFLVLLATFFTAAGWLLSAMHQLNTAGYAVASALCIAAPFVWNKRRMSAPQIPRRNTFQKWKRRFKRPLPFCFLLMSLLILLGGILHAPNNYDALSYRIPRVLNWLAENGWHWIHTQDIRMNIRAPGSEWLLAPFLALGKSDRWIFLIGFACFLAMPGLIFSVWRRLGIRRRVAWSWMWLLPSGYTFVLQAGGSANDIVGVFFALAAMDFALRARESKCAGDVWLAMLASALMTGCKTSNLPLLLPIGLALLPSLQLLLKRAALSVFIFLIALLVSFLPITFLNLKFVGDWSGYAMESSGTSSEAALRMKGASGPKPPEQFVFMAKDPLIGIAGNSVMLVVENIAPPVFPMANAWNAFVARHFPRLLESKLKENFAPSFLKIRELQGEETSGLGFGVSCLLAITMVAAFLKRKFLGPTSESFYVVVLRWSAWISLLVYAMKSGITCPARIICPYYGLLLPALLAGRATETIVRRNWWRRLAMLVYIIAFVVVIIAPERPLWPAQTVLGEISHSHPSAALERAKTVYSVYAKRPDVFARIREMLPAEARVIGMMCHFDEAGTSLWRPIGTRRVRQILLTDDRADLAAWGIRYVVAREDIADLDRWIAENGGKKIGCKALPFFAAQPPVTWCVIRFEISENNSAGKKDDAP